MHHSATSIKGVKSHYMYEVSEIAIPVSGTKQLDSDALECPPKGNMQSFVKLRRRDRDLYRTLGKGFRVGILSQEVVQI